VPQRIVRSFALLSFLIISLPLGAQFKPGSSVLLPVSASNVQRPSQTPDASETEPICPDPQFGSQRNEPVSHVCADLRKNQNNARHESLKKDTDRLLELATELKQYVDKTNEHTLSLDVIKKAEEVEKLAKKVKEKMRG
jgi:hypothetical protein